MTHRDPSRLSPDQRGAVLVPAVVMGAVLTGALFWVAAVGDAIMFRTQLQDAADITSFQSAVWHARGMNAISSLNLLMTVALGVFAILRMARIILLFVPIAGLGAAALEAPEQTAFRFISPVLNALEGAEIGVSAAVPYVAFLDAKSTPTTADTIWPLGLSLVPPRALSMIDEPRRDPRFPAALPVQAGTFGELCGKAAMVVPNQVVSLIEDHTPDWVPGFITDGVIGFVNIMIDDVGPRAFGIGDGVFCQPLSGAVTSLLGLFGQQLCDQGDQVAETAAREEEAQRAQQEGQSEPDSSQTPTRDDGRSSRGGRGNRGARSGAASERPSCNQAVDAVAEARRATAFTARPSVVWDPAKNGNAAMHVWTWAQGQPRLFRATQQGIAIADRGRLPAVTPENSAVAMAEFYFDCETSWSPECKEDAPWAPNWTARVRRFRHPALELGRIGLDTVDGFLDQLEQPLGDTAAEMSGEMIHELTGFPEDNPVAQWIGSAVNAMPFVQDISNRLNQAVGDARAASGIDALLDPRRYTEQERIH